MRRKTQRKINNNKNLSNKVHTSKFKTIPEKIQIQKSLKMWPTQQLKTRAMEMLLTLVMLTMFLTIADCQHNDHLSFSHISPKSSSNNLAIDPATYLSTSRPMLESTIVDTSSVPAPQAELHRDENDTRQHSRVERSAFPILNENFPKSSPNDVHFPNDIKVAEAGRYFQYNIKPTGTHDMQTESLESAQRTRAGKTLSSATSAATTTSSFLLNGGLRPITSGSPINPTSSTATSIVASATALPHNPRQNPNPDIQDIITGIVKLLNGNVNVHANTQGLRRPVASRINNRGPPRISEVQTLPLDYEAQKPVVASSMRPPPFPFDRPDRPFITGVPIPEQIVPYRPGFVSNRPPWHRNKPRPPITTSIGGRRPIPQYKPLPSSQMNPPPVETDSQYPTHDQQIPQVPAKESDDVDTPTVSDYNDTLESAKPTDTTYDSDFSNEDINTQYIEVSDQDTDIVAANENDELEESPQAPPSPPTKKTEPIHKKKPNKQKLNDKKKVIADEPTNQIESTAASETHMQMSSTYIPMPVDDIDGIDIDPSAEEVIFMIPNKTPSLESQITTSISSKSVNIASSTSIETSAINVKKPTETISLLSNSELKINILPTPSNFIPIPSTTTNIITTTTTTAIITTTTSTTTTEKLPTQTNPTTTPQPVTPYQPRPGIVLDDPEFQPGGRPRPQRPQQARPPAPQQPHIQPTRQHLPPGYGEIFDVTLSAIQGPGSGGGSQHTINIKPYGSYGSNGLQQNQADIIVSATGEEGFVSIDGKRTYINLFGDPTDPPAGAQVPSTPATAIPQLPGSSNVGGSGNTGSNTSGNQNTHTGIGAGYAVPETEVVELQPTKAENSKPNAQPQPATTNSGPTRPHYRQRTTQPPVRIDTCIVGDDSTCDQAQHEHCKTENGVSSCHCRPGYSRRKHREPCRKVISFYLGMRVDRIYEHRIVWDNKLLDLNSEPYGQLSYESIRAIDSAMSMTPYSDEFMEAKVNNIYRGDPNLGGSGVFVNLTIKLDESVETLRPNLRSDVQKHLLGVLHRRNNNIGNSVLYVSSPEGAVSPLQDLDECQSHELNDCHESATCTNAWGSFRCACEVGYRDPWLDQPQRAGRDCQSCPDSYCNNRGTCSYNDDGNQICACDGSHYGSQCEIDGEVLGVAIGASVAAVIIIVLTLVCLIMWSRRWQREQKNAMGSPVFGYMNTAPLKSAGIAQPGYQVTLEDRMRWAQIADVMAQTNHYGAEPIGPTRPSSAMFAYPNLQAMGMGTIGGMSMQGTMLHQNANLAPPVPLPRLGLGVRSNGMRTLENSSSSEEEDRTDLLGRNFQVPRPKSRSNGSIANQSGIYYDVDYEPSGNGIGNTSVDHLYGSQNQSSTHSHMGNSHIPGPQGIPMSTYTSGRAPSSYYMK
ncbi:flocculation protein FLO11-like isoform X1 [Teleopsis dalmanni]|uniref:flocculation protein FLO11-like isoform X1 n=1 Tax=Teleopsis dalmanni TaxID=139649 RepID=UPI0018CD425E|nr:flocculation protein FLO11-like isoform X1 [Teleopsis dalmanni]